MQSGLLDHEAIQFSDTKPSNNIANTSLIHDFGIKGNNQANA